MRISTTPDEAHAVADAITHYIEYISHMPNMTKEREEATELLARFQKRLTLSLSQNDKIPLSNPLSSDML
jgi:hypothetical protein